MLSAEMPPLGKVARVSSGVLGSQRLPTSPYLPAVTWKCPVIPLPLPLSCEPRGHTPGLVSRCMTSVDQHDREARAKGPFLEVTVLGVKVLTKGG